MSKDFTADQIGAIHIPAEERRKAARYIASKAAGKDDCTQLLAMLGLLPAHHPAAMSPSDHGRRGYRIGCRCRLCRKARAQQDREQRAARKEATA
ncbi:MAG: hypothetical protein HOV66_24085 [Streptomycetaceae bacterium]|nr:hypothetical protein [Streptomycetaceae bacterium]